MSHRIARPILWLLLVLMLMSIGSMALAAEVAPAEEVVLEEVLIEEETPPASPFFGTFWALVPPLCAIVLALITKEVYISLLVGVVIGALLYANFTPILALTTLVNEGMLASVTDLWNMGILVFVVLLGILVQMINRAGGSNAYGQWADKRIHTRRGAQLATIGLGSLIFVDDYFNCLTVGSVMRPIADRHNVSRAKLSYIIDATAAPVCMIAPISSWAAAVTGFVAGQNGMTLFIRAIPYNFYSLLTIVMLIMVAMYNIDFGPMRKHEDNAVKGDLFSGNSPYKNVEAEVSNPKAKVIDLLLPIVTLIVSCVLFMVYTGGFFEGENFVDAFANCDASLGLALGSFVAVVLSGIYMLCRRVLSFKEIAATIPDGFRAMVPAILILIFAWTLSGMTRMLGAGAFVEGMLSGNLGALSSFLPAIIFLIAFGLAFSTGTSWGTFGILLPIVVAVINPEAELLIIAIAACLAGGVCGDHCSPISDTTIMASTGAQCDHVTHVSTQLPYAMVVAAVSFVFYILAGFVQSAWIVLPIAIVCMIGVMLILKKSHGREHLHLPKRHGAK